MCYNQELWITSEVHLRQQIEVTKSFQLEVRMRGGGGGGILVLARLLNLCVTSLGLHFFVESPAGVSQD